MAEEKKQLKKKAASPDPEMIRQLQFLRHLRVMQMVNELQLLGAKEKQAVKKGADKK